MYNSLTENGENIGKGIGKVFHDNVKDNLKHDIFIKLLEEDTIDTFFEKIINNLKELKDSEDITWKYANDFWSKRLIKMENNFNISKVNFPETISSENKKKYDKKIKDFLKELNKVITKIKGGKKRKPNKTRKQNKKNQKKNQKKKSTIKKIKLNLPFRWT